MTSTDSDRILAAGVPIELAGGEARLRFDFLAYHRLEERFGTIPAAAGKLNELWEASTNVEDPLNVPVLEDLAAFIAAGTRKTVEEVLDEMVSHGDLGLAIGAYIYACRIAWSEAFPQPRAEGNEEGEETEPSPGPTPTGSSPASPAAAMATSGA